MTYFHSYYIVGTISSFTLFSVLFTEIKHIFVLETKQFFLFCSPQLNTSLSLIFVLFPSKLSKGYSHKLHRPLSRPLWKVMIGIGGFFSILAILMCYFGRRIILNQIVGFSKSKEKENYQKFEAFLRNYGSLAPKRYTYSEVKKITNCFKDKLGQGGYGSVYKGKLDDGHLVAVKILSEIKDNGEDFINEVASISRTSHVNIVTLMGFCFEKNKRALVYEFVSNGSLDKHIYHNGQEVNLSLGWKNFERITIGVARGLDYLHQGCNTRILHFDIKPQNILLDDDFCPKISDFGLSKLCQRKVSHISMLGTRGTAGYIAPEVFSRNFGPVSYKSDVYSFGMMVLDMVGGRQHLKNGISSHSDEMFFPDWIYKLIEPGHGSRIFGGMTTEEEETVRKMILVSLWCIQTKPSDRPSMNKVLEMFEASVYSLQIPPRPILSTPEAYENQINTSIMSSEISSHEP
ncbi:hypothetical protein K2173_001304 [Erythroxylum novogranatense]|uniref:Protein kinase domain-containing protein n=1 Tax=Erythroxylum novogranatense TaxID=1862640 RepID=A0AAV8T3W5_9ROSI|nr:hypothetical protein K2173_001304 [Erythroxylum novogranatense]